MGNDATQRRDKNGKLLEAMLKKPNSVYPSSSLCVKNPTEKRTGRG
jgi:hypothetical protein